MKNIRVILCQLGLANEEKARFRKQANELITKFKAIEESSKENSKTMVDQSMSYPQQSRTNEKKMELMRKRFEAKNEINKMLANEVPNLRLQLVESRKHRFGCTSEQRKLQNKRNLNKSAMEKSRV